MPRPLLRSCLASAGLVLLASALWTGCSDEENPLAPYDGHRPLDILKVTQSFTPEVQWVGGRVAAVGVNRGERAALDSSLVWLRTAPGNSISSVVAVGPEHDRDLVASFGGTPLDSLADGETYTFWLAEADAFAAGLDSAAVAPGTFADTTLTMQLVLRGQSGGDRDLGVQFRIVRDERITGERYVVTWEPEDVLFRRVAIRQAPTGGFQDLIWHIVVPEEEPPSIAPPLTIGVAPEGVQEAEAFPETGFEPAVHILWAATDDWTGGFGPSTQGYAWFRIFADNFEPDTTGGRGLIPTGFPHQP